LAEIRSAQDELGNRIDRRAGKLAAPLAVRSSAPDATTFAKTLGRTVEVGEPRATHRQPKRRYKTRVRMPSKLDPHVPLIESWLAAEPRLTALAIVGRLAERDPQQFGPKQHSIVQRLLRAIRRRATQQLIAEPVSPALAAEESIIRPPGPVDGAGYGGPAPSTVLRPCPASRPQNPHQQTTCEKARSVTFSGEAIRGVKIARRSTVPAVPEPFAPWGGFAENRAMNGAHA
jgi:hypothetical protein